jgi:hypothetical protein
MKTVKSDSLLHGELRGKRGFGATENEIYCRRKLHSLPRLLSTFIIYRSLYVCDSMSIDRTALKPPTGGSTRPGTLYHYLQKSLTGGIMMIELSFREVYFSVNVYAFECSRTPVSGKIGAMGGIKTVNAQVLLCLSVCLSACLPACLSVSA